MSSTKNIFLSKSPKDVTERSSSNNSQPKDKKIYSINKVFRKKN